MNLLLKVIKFIIYSINILLKVIKFIIYSINLLSLSEKNIHSFKYRKGYGEENFAFCCLLKIANKKKDEAKNKYTYEITK